LNIFNKLIESRRNKNKDRSVIVKPSIYSSAVWASRYKVTIKDGTVIQEYLDNSKFNEDYKRRVGELIANYVSEFGLNSIHLVNFLIKHQRRSWK
jgi:hypothetical protein